jgi:hypothetical protein
MFVFWGRNQKGMQAAAQMNPNEIAAAQFDWLAARDQAVEQARKLLARGLHKQNVNRLLEPWMHIAVICTATDWANFYHLRRHPDAQPEMQALANAMWAAHQASEPVDRTHAAGIDAWHLPLVSDDERRGYGAIALKIAVGRCARVSYLTHDGRRDVVADVELAKRLQRSGHWSPFEHVAAPHHRPWWKRFLGHDERCGNFVGWQQYRKTLTGEHPYSPGQVEP